MANATTVVRGVLRTSGSRPAALLDITGRKVLGLAPGTNDLHRLAPGIYFIRFELAAVEKVVVTR